MLEKEQADKELQAALPYLRRAESAVDSIKPKDISEMKGTRNPVDTTRIILDTINILFMASLAQVTPKTCSVQKANLEFICDSYEDHTKTTLVKSTFL